MDHVDHPLFLAVFYAFCMDRCMDHPGHAQWIGSSEKTRMNTKSPSRTRLPNRRPLITETLVIGASMAAVDFDAGGQPRELFLSGAKDGTDLAAILDDASVVLSVALQHGVSPAALVRSVARLPTAPLAPPYLDQIVDGSAEPASVIGAALDLVHQLEPSETDHDAA